MVAGQSCSQALADGVIGVTGQREAVAALFDTLDSFAPMFAILEP